VPRGAAPRPAPPKAPPPPLTAAHGSEIVALGVTADGGAVASADRLGGLRLWPALDGTREPIVIQGTAARAVALAREGDGFALSTLDDAGGVHIMRISAAGAVRERITVANEQRAIEIDGTPEGLVVLRADQTLELVDGAGQVRSRLTPDPGVHVDSVLVRGPRVLALVQEGKRVHGQWIEIDHGMHWGAATPKLAIKVAHAVLSPDGTLLAVSRPRSLHPVLIDLATGAPRKTPLCVTKEWPGDDGDTASELLRTDNTPVPLGFVSAKVVACSVTGTVQWWATDGTPRQNVAGTFSIGALPAAVSDGALVIGMGPNLGIATPTSNKFLGYGLHDAAQLHSGPSGLLISGGDQALLLDASLHERARFELGRNPLEWRDAILIDERYAITVSPRRGYPRDEGYQLAVFDGIARAQHQLMQVELRDKDLRYEPSTGLLTAADATGSMLLQLDPRTHTFGKPIRIASWLPPSRVVPLDPTLAGGVAALELDDAGDGVIVGEFPLADIQPGATISARTTYRLSGALRATDRTGRVYMQPRDAEEIVVYARGVGVARLPALTGMALSPSPDGSHVAAFATPRLVMLTAGGQVRWETALWNSADIAWTSSGDLVAQWLSGIAQVDVRTGALVERRCGWSFGLSDLPLDVGHTGPTICEVAR
jgi:hypothetical protein